MTETKPADEALRGLAAQVRSPEPKWGTWRSHGNPQAFYYHGSALAGPTPDGKLVTQVIKSGNGNRYLDQDQGIFGAGVAGKFWAVPAVKREEVRHSSDGDAIAVIYEPASQDEPAKDKPVCPECKADIGHLPGCKTLDKKAGPAGKAHVPTASKAPSDCLCGCGTKTRSTYAPGHDARHVRQLRQAIAAKQTTAAKAAKELPTQKLRDKLEAQLARTAK